VCGSHAITDGRHDKLMTAHAFSTSVEGPNRMLAVAALRSPYVCNGPLAQFIYDYAAYGAANFPQAKNNAWCYFRYWFDKGVGTRTSLPVKYQFPSLAKSSAPWTFPNAAAWRVAPSPPPRAITGTSSCSRPATRAGAARACSSSHRGQPGAGARH
jgi:hypothetical protein